MALDTTIGGATADSYVTLAQYVARAAAFGWTLAATDAENEVNLRKARLANDVRNQFGGVRLFVDQACEFPRIYAGLVNGWPVPIDAIPDAIQFGQMEMAYQIQNGRDPLANVDALISKESVKAGPVETTTEYMGGLGKQNFASVDALLRPYLSGVASQTMLVRA